jgi:hypothetical protein
MASREMKLTDCSLGLPDIFDITKEKNNLLGRVGWALLKGPCP